MSKMEIKPFNIPSKAHYIIEEAPWIKEHGSYMALQLKRDVSHLEATSDFETGYEHYDFQNNKPLDPPDPNFKDHLSLRGLTWHQEYNIWYWHNFSLPAIKAGTIADKNNRHFAAKQYLTLKRDRILKYRPLVELIAA